MSRQILLLKESWYIGRRLNLEYKQQREVLNALYSVILYLADHIFISIYVCTLQLHSFMESDIIDCSSSEEQIKVLRQKVLQFLTFFALERYRTVIAFSSTRSKVTKEKKPLSCNVSVQFRNSHIDSFHIPTLLKLRTVCIIYVYVHACNQSSLSEALLVRDLTSTPASSFFWFPYHPRAPSLSGRMGCEKWQLAYIQSASMLLRL